jgi:hypothetical protein
VSAPFWAASEEGFEGPLYAANPWEIVELAGEKLPGLCRVTAPQSKYRLDTQSTNGVDGGEIVLRGYEPGALGFDCTVWTPAQWERLQAVIKKLWEKPGKIVGTTSSKQTAAQTKTEAQLAEKRALGIVHPALQLLGITRVVIESIVPPEPGPAPQSMVVTFRLQEFVPPVAKTAKARKVAGTATTMVEPVEAFRMTPVTAPANMSVAPPSSTDAGPLMSSDTSLMSGG